MFDDFLGNVNPNSFILFKNILFFPLTIVGEKKFLKSILYSGIVKLIVVYFSHLNTGLLSSNSPVSDSTIFNDISLTINICFLID